MQLPQHSNLREPKSLLDSVKKKLKTQHSSPIKIENQKSGGSANTKPREDSGFKKIDDETKEGSEKE